MKTANLRVKPECGSETGGGGGNGGGGNGGWGEPNFPSAAPPIPPDP